MTLLIIAALVAAAVFAAKYVWWFCLMTYEAVMRGYEQGRECALEHVPAMEEFAKRHEAERRTRENFWKVMNRNRPS